MHPHSLTKDEKIVSLILQKDQTGIELLYDCYGGALYGTILRLVNDASIADKVLSATFEKIFNDVEAFRPECSSFFTWVMNIARSLAKDYIFAYSKTTDCKDNKDIFDLMINKGLSMQTAADLLGIDKSECGLQLRAELKKLKSNQP